MNYLALDLEMNQPSNKIISVGAVVGDMSTGLILEEMNILTQIDEPISEYISKLTGIDNEGMEYKHTLLEAYESLKDLHTKHACFRNAITWGGGDSECLRNQLRESVDWCLGRRWLDYKTVWLAYAEAKGLPGKGGLAKTLTKLGMNFKGTKHNSKDDARNTFLLAYELQRRIKNGI